MDDALATLPELTRDDEAVTRSGWRRAWPAGFRVAALYALTTFLYIAASDRLLALVVDDVTAMTRLQTAKGLGFVVVSALFVAWLVQREVRASARADERIRAAADEFGRLLEHSHDIIHLVDSDRRILFISAAVETHLGYTPAELIGQDAREFVHPDDWPAADGSAMAALEGHPDAKADLRLRTRTGEWRWFRTVPTLLETEGRPPRLVINSTDITDQKRAASEREDLEVRLRQSQKMEAIGRLAGGIAHDFNNLLTVISGNTDLLLEQMEPDASHRMELEEVERAAHSAADLTRHLLAFARQQVLRPRVIDMDGAVRRMLPLLRRALGARIDVRTSLDSGDARVEADPVQLEQVLLNLVLNARDAMPDGGTVTIATRQQRLDGLQPGRFGQTPPSGHVVVLSVEDTGTGMDAATVDRIFEPFFTTKEAGKGTGLGLSTVLGIMQQSGGYIEVDTAPGGGSRFDIFLPWTRGKEDRPEPIAESAPARSDATVLLVEDEAGVRSLIARLLKRQGYAVLEAGSASLALALLERDGPAVDMLLTDIVMPGMTGDELARRVRQRFPDLPILFISGHPRDAHLGGGVLAENVAFLAKPFTPQTLLQQVREIVEA